ncbi:hypothetical protein AMTRI_Chr01g110480 [Amborella trichopoda]
MGRRAHLTELGCIVCEELEQLGAGKEGWLDSPNLYHALDSNSLALANENLVLVLGWIDDSRPITIRPSFLSHEGKISAIEWLIFDDHRVLALATSQGYLLLYSLASELIHKQMLYPERIIKLRSTHRQGFHQDHSSAEVCVVFPSVIVRFNASDIESLVHRWFQERSSRLWGDKMQKREAEDIGNSYGRLPHQLWNVNKFGPCVDAAVIGIMPPPLMEYESSQRYYCAVIIGHDAVISAFRLSEDRKRSLVGTILSKVVPATFSTLTSLSKMIWRSDEASTRPVEVKPQAFAKASLLTCLKDHPRKGEKLTLSPGGSLAVITDSLGRILLLDTQALVVIRLWKGYRDACCFFMEMLVGKDMPSNSVEYGNSKSDYCLCLAIHAPRREVVEVWKMRMGPRLLTLPCAKGSMILQPTSKLESSLASPSSYTPLEVFLLNGDSGQFTVLNRFIN